MLEVFCSGTPHEIGFAHGSQARSKVEGSLAFYEKLFEKNCKLDWSGVKDEASKYVEPLQKTSPRYLAEIQGIADGSNRGFLDILALNVRTEIMFGLWTDDDAKDKVEPQIDGCTAISWLVNGTGKSFLSQNWDWMVEQSPNIFVCHVSQPGTEIPDLSMVTEGGIIGKIGFNQNGVGCTLNAIRARGLDPSKLPIHFALRTVLESPSRAAAVERIKSAGVAGSGHILVADATGSVGLECVSRMVREYKMDERGRVIHTNHLLLEHPETEEPPWLLDSPGRLARARLLADTIPESEVGFPTLFSIYKDEEGYPGCICRREVGGSIAETLFNIMMDLTDRKAVVSFGRPTEPKEHVTLAF